MRIYVVRWWPSAPCQVVRGNADLRWHAERDHEMKLFLPSIIQNGSMFRLEPENLWCLLVTASPAAVMVHQTNGKNGAQMKQRRAKKNLQSEVQSVFENVKKLSSCHSSRGGGVSHGNPGAFISELRFRWRFPPSFPVRELIREMFCALRVYVPLCHFSVGFSGIIPLFLDEF